jgi:type I restriction enzyme, S subunit
VPAHWFVEPLKRSWSVTDCKHLTAVFVEDGIPLASIREVQSRYVDLANAKRTTKEFYLQLIEGGRAPMAGDLVFSRNATVGEVAQVPADGADFAMGQDVCLLRRLNPETSPDFMQFVIRSSVVVGQLETLMIGSTFRRVNVEVIRALVMPIPPIAEQRQIAEHLSSISGELDALADEARQAASLLDERRSALISAAVTGQIDVRGLVEQEAA